MLTVDPNARERWWVEMLAGTDLPDVDDLLQRPSWHRDAACRSMGPDLFFPDMGESPARAKAVCERCTVAEACGAAGRELGGGYGVWGGTSASDRRRRGAAAPGALIQPDVA